MKTYFSSNDSPNMFRLRHQFLYAKTLVQIRVRIFWNDIITDARNAPRESPWELTAFLEEECRIVF